MKDSSKSGAGVGTGLSEHSKITEKEADLGMCTGKTYDGSKMQRRKQAKGPAGDGKHRFA